MAHDVEITNMIMKSNNSTLIAAACILIECVFAIRPLHSNIKGPNEPLPQLLNSDPKFNLRMENLTKNKIAMENEKEITCEYTRLAHHIKELHMEIISQWKANPLGLNKAMMDTLNQQRNTIMKFQKRQVVNMEEEEFIDFSKRFINFLKKSENVCETILNSKRTMRNANLAGGIHTAMGAPPLTTDLDPTFFTEFIETKREAAGYLSTPPHSSLP